MHYLKFSRTNIEQHIFWPYLLWNSFRDSLNSSNVISSPVDSTSAFYKPHQKEGVNKEEWPHYARNVHPSPTWLRHGAQCQHTDWPRESASVRRVCWYSQSNALKLSEEMSIASSGGLLREGFDHPGASDGWWAGYRTCDTTSAVLGCYRLGLPYNGTWRGDSWQMDSTCSSSKVGSGPQVPQIPELVSPTRETAKSVCLHLYGGLISWNLNKEWLGYPGEQ